MRGERRGAMREPIQVNYVPDGDDWSVTVNGRGQQLTGTAVGLIAARDRADQLVEKVAPNEEYRTVVHLLNGDAVDFTTAYLTARLSRTTEPEPAPKAAATTEDPPAKPAADGEQAAAEPKTKPAEPKPKAAKVAEPKAKAAAAAPAPKPKPRPAPAKEPEKKEPAAAELNGAASPPA